MLTQDFDVLPAIDVLEGRVVRLHQGRREAVTILRREHARMYERKRFDTVELDDTVPEEAAFASPERSGDAAQVRDAMLKLPDKYREPLAMQVLGGMSCDEIAAATHQQPGAVMTQLFRARQRLKDLLGGRAAAEGGRK